jgi:hypothetical protein
MEKSAKETVIIVHGTWAAPDPDERRWYLPNDDRPCGLPFIDNLDAALAARGSSARCWAHCDPEHPAFHWSGENSWIDRTLAASALADYVAKLRTEGWHCHIVAHSHGGNVLIEALPHIMTSLDSQQPQARLVTLGTPFLDTTSPILQRIKTRTRILRLVSWISFAAVIAYASNDVRSNWKDLRWNELNSDHILFGLAAVFLFAIFFGRMRRGRDESGDASQTQPKVLASAARTMKPGKSCIIFAAWITRSRSSRTSLVTCFRRCARRLHKAGPWPESTAQSRFAISEFSPDWRWF